MLLDIHPLKNNLFLTVISIVLILFSFRNLIYLIPLLIYLTYLFYHSKQVFLYSIYISGIVVLIYFFNESIKCDYSTNIKGIITDLNEYDSYTRYIVRTGVNKILIYDYDNLGYRIGDIVSIEGYIKDTDTYFIPNDFDYNEYLKHNHIGYALVSESIYKSNHIFLIGEIRQYLIKYFNSNFDMESASFMKALLLGYSKDLDEEFYSSLKENGILHLFAISGLHVQLFTEIIKTILKKAKISEKGVDRIIISFLIVYSFLTNMSASILRTAIMNIIAILSKRRRLDLSSADVCSLSFILMIVFNPYFIYNNGFILSYLVTFVLILSSNITWDMGYVKGILINSIFASFATLPLIINMNYSINLLTPVLNVLFIFLMTNLLLPLTIIFAFVPKLSIVYSYLVKGFTFISSSVSRFSLSVTLGKFSDVSIIIFYCLILLCLTNKKKIIGYLGLGILLLVQANLPLLNNKTKIYFLDMYYGESTVIFSPHKRSVIVIDTGDGTNLALSKFLLSKGVRNIEYLFITHDHSDHNGEVNELIKNFKIDHIVSSVFDSSIYSNDIKVLKNDIIKIDNYLFQVLAPYEASDEINDNSLVLYTVIDGRKYLFMGDATSNIESNINIGKIDILKVGHHGSSTSSSISFLENTRPTYSIIMATRISLYGFPSNKTIENLNCINSNTYRTDKMKSILLISSKKRLEFRYLVKWGNL